MISPTGILASMCYVLDPGWVATASRLIPGSLSTPHRIFARLIKTSREVNDLKISSTVERAIALIEEHPYANVACCGLAFKANVDDLRESPALEVAHQLASRYGTRIKIVEPNIRNLPPEIAEHGAELMELDEAIKTCEVAIVLVDHDQFKMIPLGERRHLAVIDTRGIWQDMPAAEMSTRIPS